MCEPIIAWEARVSPAAAGHGPRQVQCVHDALHAAGWSTQSEAERRRRMRVSTHWGHVTPGADQVLHHGHVT